jgi:acetyltransferase-like isoleucine patch superfamily enzyme
MIIIRLYNSLKKRIYLKRLFKKSKILIESPFSINCIEKLVIEPYVYIGPGAIFTTYGKISIYSGSILGPRVKIHTGNHRYEGVFLPYDKEYIIEDVLIEENVWIGSDVIILPGVTIGEGSIVGAGSVVSKSVPKFSIVGGNPTKILKERDVNHYLQLKEQNRIYLIDKFGRI